MTLCEGHDASTSFASDWFLMSRSVALQFVWQNLTGTLDGIFACEVTLDKTQPHYGFQWWTILVDIPDNDNDNFFVEMLGDASYYYRVTWTPSGVSSGEITVFMSELRTSLGLGT